MRCLLRAVITTETDRPCFPPSRNDVACNNPCADVLTEGEGNVDLRIVRNDKLSLCTQDSFDHVKKFVENVWTKEVTNDTGMIVLNQGSHYVPDDEFV